MPKSILLSLTATKSPRDHFSRSHADVCSAEKKHCHSNKIINSFHART